METIKCACGCGNQLVFVRDGVNYCSVHVEQLADHSFWFRMKLAIRHVFLKEPLLVHDSMICTESELKQIERAVNIVRNEKLIK